VTAALTAVCKVVSGDAVSSVLPQVADCLKHPSDHVRKKAVMALHRFYQRAPATVAHMTTPLRQMLADPVRSSAVGFVGPPHAAAAGPVRHGGHAVRHLEPGVR